MVEFAGDLDADVECRLEIGARGAGSLGGRERGGKHRAGGMDASIAMRHGLRIGVVEIVGVDRRSVGEGGESRRGPEHGAEHRRASVGAP